MMKTILSFLLAATLCAFLPAQVTHKPSQPERTLFVFGGDINQKFVNFVVDLTGKTDPRICFVPTASGDNERTIKYWEFLCRDRGLIPLVLKVWVSSDPANPSFEETLLSMDAIVVGGGNTLNMLGIWKAQGIDRIMRQAYEKGIVLAGGSAGSICWFQSGVSDSRPTALSLVEGLGLLPYSNCPHYDQPARKELYLQEIAKKSINDGFACDNLAGILFRNEKVVEALSQNDVNHAYRIELKNGVPESIQLPDRILVRPGAIPEDAYLSKAIGQTVAEFPDQSGQESPLSAFVSIKRLFAQGQNSRYRALCCASLQPRLKEDTPDRQVEEKERDGQLNTRIEKVLIYKDRLAGVINRMYPDFYGLWFFYFEDGKWMSAGEDVGGETIFQAELGFREKAEMHLEKVKKKPAEERP